MSAPAARSDGAAFRIVGHRAPRPDATDKVFGLTRYADDFAMAGMLHAKVVRSPARRRGSSGSTRARPKGCRGPRVLTARDVPHNVLFSDVPGQTTTVGPSARGRRCSRTRSCASRRGRRARGRRERGGRGGRAPGGRRVRGPSRRLRSRGGAASRRAPARAHGQRGSRAGRSARATSMGFGGRRRRRAELLDAVHRSRLHRARGGRGLARRERRDHDPRRDAGHRALPRRRQRAGAPALPGPIIAPYIGGGFGGKEDVTVEVFLGLLVWKTTRPVRLCYSREESIVSPTKRHPFVMRYKHGARRKCWSPSSRADLRRGRLRVPVAADAPLRDGPRGGAVPDPPRQGGRSVGPDEQPPDLRLPRLRLGAAGVRLREPDGRAGPNPRPGSLDCPRAELPQKGERLASGQELETAVWLPETARRAWDALGPRAPSGPGKRVGRGLPRRSRRTGGSCGSTTGRARGWSSRWTARSWSGAGSPTSAAARRPRWCRSPRLLGVAQADIAVHIGDSALTPLAGTTTATRQLYMSGSAVHKAASELRATLLAQAAELLAAAPDAVDLADARRSCGRLRTGGWTSGSWPRPARGPIGRGRRSPSIRRRPAR